jgi:DNA-binding PadR family transcriptional regulator
MLINQSSVKLVILGLLRQDPQSGYDLKKIMLDSSIFFWSGNNNQIYTSLTQLYRDGMVTYIVKEMEGKPPKKIYTITKKGEEQLEEWILSEPALPQLENIFMIKLYLSDHLGKIEKNKLIKDYEDEVAIKLLMVKEEKKRGMNSIQSQPRIKKWGLLMDNVISFYENELNWISIVKNSP